MEDILEKIAAYARIRVREKKKVIPDEEIIREAEQRNCDTGFPFERALRKEGMSFICECKKASPSKGVIARDFPYLAIAREYEEAGAAAISCLSEPKWFLGNDRYVKEIARSVRIPVLRKDFTVDPYMIYEAKLLGADAVLLIMSLLSGSQTKEMIRIADSLGLSVLAETHDESEVEQAVSAGARIIGVNNRNLRDFTVDIHNSIRLREKVPADILMVAESGIRTQDDIAQLEKGHVDAVLIGETLMRAADKGKMLKELKGV